MKLKRIERLGNEFKIAGASGKKAHVMSRNGHWVVFREGSDRVLNEFTSKTYAIRSGKELLRAGRAEVLVLHKADGTVERTQLAGN